MQPKMFRLASGTIVKALYAHAELEILITKALLLVFKHFEIKSAEVRNSLYYVAVS